MKEYSNKLQQDRAEQAENIALEILKKQYEEEAKKNDAIIKIQNAIRNKRAIDKFSTLYVENRIKPQLIQQQTEEAKKNDAIIKIQNAIRAKQAKSIFSKRKTVKDAFDTYKISNDLQKEMPKSNIDKEKVKELKQKRDEADKLKRKQEKQRIQAIKQMKPSSFTDYRQNYQKPKPTKFQIHQNKKYGYM